jgi:hypothetical protein
MHELPGKPRICAAIAEGFNGSRIENHASVIPRAIRELLQRFLFRALGSDRNTRPTGPQYPIECMFLDLVGSHATFMGLKNQTGDVFTGDRRCNSIINRQPYEFEDILQTFKRGLIVDSFMALAELH